MTTDQSPNTNSFNADHLRQVVSTITGFAIEIEKIVSAAMGGSLNQPQIESLTVLFGNLAGVAIQAAHDALGREITPDSVLALLPAATPLRPAAG